MADRAKVDLAVTAIYRWEADYLREWVAFHRLVGVERFFLYDNRSEDSHRVELAPFIADGSVVLHDWPMFPGQAPANNHCLAKHGAEARWIAFIDVDEFLFSPTGRPVPEVLERFADRPGVGVSRAWMGTAGHERKPDGPVLANFDSRLDLPEPNLAVKCIVDPERVARRVNEHWFEFLDGEPPVDEHGRALTSWFRDELTFDTLRINHYFTKSEEEAARKFERPSAGNNLLRGELNLQALRRRNATYGRPDQAIQQYLPALERSLAELK